MHGCEVCLSEDVMLALPATVETANPSWLPEHTERSPAKCLPVGATTHPSIQRSFIKTTQAMAGSIQSGVAIRTSHLPHCKLYKSKEAICCALQPAETLGLQ